MERANAEQAAEWDGPAGEHRVRFAEVFEARSDGYLLRLQEAAGVGATDLVLDIGCGTGQSTRAAARAAVDGAVHGIDLSARMIEAARARAAEEGLRNVTFEQGDAQVHPFPAARFGLAISLFGSMFFADPVAAFANVGRAVRPGGRLVMVVWQDRERQEWFRTVRASLAAGQTLPQPGGAGPFALADPDAVRGILDAAGYYGIGFTELREPVYYGPDVDTACDLVHGLRSVKELLARLEPAEREPAQERLRTAVAAHQTGDGVRFDSRAWMISAMVRG